MCVEDNMEFNFHICDEDKCTGCFACMNKCPKNAITSKIDDVGRTLPFIDKDKCVKCGVCVKTCPVNNPVKMQEPTICYAAQQPDKVLRDKSASGGIGAVLSEYIISTGGCVFGSAVVGKQGEVKHICAESKDEINRLRGSKYVQSDIGFSFKQVKEKLIEGKQVLFTGTPCQIAGLKNYLGKDYENLYCVDLICHGTPPMQYLREHYQVVANGEEIDSVSFRNPSIGYYLTLKNNGKTIYSSERFHDKYFYGFFRGLTYRENCYDCHYAGDKRCSDITIGDFWGIKRKTLKQIKSGCVSVILINNDKGKFLFDKINDKLIFEEREIIEAVTGNHQLREPTIKHKFRQTFIEAYKAEQDFGRAVDKTDLLKEMKKENVKWKIQCFKSKIIWKLNSLKR